METNYKVSFEHPDHSVDPPLIVENENTAMQALERINELKAHGYLILSIVRDGTPMSEKQLVEAANTELVSR